MPGLSANNPVYECKFDHTHPSVKRQTICTSHAGECNIEMIPVSLLAVTPQFVSNDMEYGCAFDRTLIFLPSNVRTASAVSVLIGLCLKFMFMACATMATMMMCVVCQQPRRRRRRCRRQRQPTKPTTATSAATTQNANEPY